jgi:hypothetical protein
LGNSGRRRLVKGTKYRSDIERIRQSSERAAEIIAAFELVVVRIPEHGMAVPGKPGFYSRPFHTDEGSYLVIYTFDDDQVTCSAIRSVPSGRF